MDYLSLAKKPITGKNPAGADISYEEIFQNLENEISKLSNPAVIDEFSWDKVLEYSSDILADHSKDIRAAAYLSASLVYKDGLNGLDNAISIMNDILETFWQNLFPPIERMRARTGAINWWIEKTEKALRDKDKFDSADKKLIKNIEKKFKKIEKFLTDNIKENPPSFEKIFLKLENIKDDTIDANSLNSQDITETEHKTAAYSDANKTTRQNFNSVIDTLKKLARVIMQKNPTDPRCYRWVRFAAWEHIETHPPAIRQKTNIPSPSYIENLIDLEKSQNWKMLLDTVEAKIYMSSYIFLLDINYYAALALENLGESYRNAYNAVCYETYNFANRLSGIENFLFADEKPFAEEHTKKWIINLKEKISLKKNESIDIKNFLIIGEKTIEKQIIKIKNSIIKKKGFINAIEKIQHKIDRSVSEKEILLWRLGLIDVLFSHKAAIDIINPHIEEILMQIKTFQLTKWEPAIAIHVLKTVYNVYKKQKDYKEKAAEILNDISKVSPVEAILLNN